MTPFEAITEVASSTLEFTSDEVLSTLDDHDEKSVGRADLGPAFLRAAREGIIEATPHHRRSIIPRRHREVRVWRSIALAEARPQWAKAQDRGVTDRLGRLIVDVPAWSCPWHPEPTYSTKAGLMQHFRRYCDAVDIRSDR